MPQTTLSIGRQITDRYRPLQTATKVVIVSNYQPTTVVFKMIRMSLQSKYLN